MADTLGSRITENRKRLDLTQDQLAEKMNVSAQAVSKWENDLSCPDITLLAPLADLFGITVDQLLRGDNANGVRMLPEGERKSIDKMLLRVRVNSADGDKVNVNLPLSLIKVCLEVGMQMPEINGGEAIKNVDFGAILMMAERGAIGKIVEVQGNDGDTVEVVIE